MRYYINRVCVDVLLLFSEMGKNLKADKQNPQSTHTMNDWEIKFFKVFYPVWIYTLKFLCEMIQFST